MSARAELLREMTHNHLYMDDERAAELVDAFARELAEEQRAYARECGLTLVDGAYVSLGDVIDLIDPSAGSETPAPVNDGRCRATLQGWPIEVVDECAREAGHYDASREPDLSGNEPDPGGWHQSAPDPDGNRTTWSDEANGATPHRAGSVRPDEEPTP
jgi:hypothetical protein